MSDAPACRHRFGEVNRGLYECRSAAVNAPYGVPLSYCGRCPYRNLGEGVPADSPNLRHKQGAKPRRSVSDLAAARRH